MKTLIILWTLLISTSAWAGEIEELREMYPAEERTTMEVMDYGAIIGYTPNTPYWWSGLAIRNSSQPASFQIYVKDTKGDVVGRGSLYLSAYCMKKGILSEFITEGYIPQQGHTLIYSSEYFAVTVFVGTGGIGDGFSHLEVRGVGF